MKMKECSVLKCATFKSKVFEPILSDEFQVNPETYGAELAWWLCTQLSKTNHKVHYPNSEDWGWYLEYTTEDGSGHEYWLCCSNLIDEEGLWRVYLAPQSKGFFPRTTAPIEEAKGLMDELNRILTTADIIETLEWHREIT